MRVMRRCHRTRPIDRGGWWSPSFLIDREGRIRWVHPGGALPMSDDDGAEAPAFKDLIKKLDQILLEKPSASQSGSEGAVTTRLAK